MDHSEQYEFLVGQKTYLVRESYLDTLGHVNNASYIQLLEEARWDLIESNGYGLSVVMQQKMSPVVLELSCRFIKEVLNRENVSIITQVTEYKGKVGNINQKIIKECGELACIANFKFALFDLQTRKIIEPTEKWLAAIAKRKV